MTYWTSRFSRQRPPPWASAIPRCCAVAACAAPPALRLLVRHNAAHCQLGCAAQGDNASDMRRRPLERSSAQTDLAEERRDGLTRRWKDGPRYPGLGKTARDM